MRGKIKRAGTRVEIKFDQELTFYQQVFLEHLLDEDEHWTLISHWGQPKVVIATLETELAWNPLNTLLKVIVWKVEACETEGKTS